MNIQTRITIHSRFEWKKQAIQNLFSFFYIAKHNYSFLCAWINFLAVAR